MSISSACVIGVMICVKYLPAHFSARSCLLWLCIQQMLVRNPLMIAVACQCAWLLNDGVNSTAVVMMFIGSPVESLRPCAESLRAVSLSVPDALTL